MSRYHNLIVNADDLGMSKEKNEGIIAAAKEKLIHSASFCVTSKHSNQDLNQAIALLADIPIGLHLSLTEGSPVKKEGIEILLAGNGKFRSASELLTIEKALKAVDLEGEIAAQIEKFTSIFNAKPSHLDCHQYFTYLSPTAFAAFTKVASKYQIPIRSHLPFAIKDRLTDFTNRVFRRYKVALPFDPTKRSLEIQKIFEANPIPTRTHDVVIDFEFQSEGIDFDKFVDISMPVEVVCHPCLNTRGIIEMG